MLTGKGNNLSSIMLPILSAKSALGCRGALSESPSSGLSRDRA